MFLRQTTANKVLVKIVKNKHAPPFRTAEFEIAFGKGVDRESELIDLGCKHNLISKAGAMLKMNDQTFRGQDAFKKYLCQNTSVRDELEKKLRDELMNLEPSHEDDSSGGAVEGGNLEDVVASDITDEEALAVAEA